MQGAHDEIPGGIAAHEQAGPAIARFVHAPSPPYLLVAGDARETLRLLPDACVDAVITSPPYWQQREYDHPESIGREPTAGAYVAALLRVLAEVRRVLRPMGSLWLNLGDTYRGKSLCGIPWRVAIALQDEQGWILRNDVVWHKRKGGPDNAPDKLRNVHEYLFHFVAQRRYHYDGAAVRNQPRPPTARDGQVVTPTGVSGAGYRRQIQRSAALTAGEKAAALRALDEALARVAAGTLADFRMVIRGQQRTTHSDATSVSGRAQELARRGFYVLPYHAQGAKRGDVWEIIPEDRWRTDGHYAPFPEALCALPIEATCPPGGIVLDPFAGTGTALLAACRRGRRAIGIDLCRAYLEGAAARLRALQAHVGAGRVES